MRFVDDYKIMISFLKADASANGVRRPLLSYFFNRTWCYLVKLRFCEFVARFFGKGWFYKILKFYLYRYGESLGFTIPPFVFGKGLGIAHVGTIVVNDKAQIGENCRIHVCVNIGVQAGGVVAPKIGNNCYIGPGAKIYGGIEIGDRCAIGANSVVNKSFLESSLTLAGIPAKIISRKGAIH